MQIQITNGWLQETATISHRLSDNTDARPDTAITLLVIHHISLPPHTFGGDDIVAFFTNQLPVDKHQFYSTIKDLRVSAHILIKRNGAIVQFVDFGRRAWHAGKSCHNGKKNCNDFSIGIELEGDQLSPYRYAQYKVLGSLTQALQATYPIVDIVGHQDIAPQRKSDPGPTFDWQRYRRMLNHSE